jgi:hypothetical protein
MSPELEVEVMRKALFKMQKERDDWRALAERLREELVEEKAGGSCRPSGPNVEGLVSQKESKSNDK